MTFRKKKAKNIGYDCENTAKNWLALRRIQSRLSGGAQLVQEAVGKKLENWKKDLHCFCVLISRQKYIKTKKDTLVT